MTKQWYKNIKTKEEAINTCYYNDRQLTEEEKSIFSLLEENDINKIRKAAEILEKIIEVEKTIKKVKNNKECLITEKERKNLNILREFERNNLDIIKVINEKNNNHFTNVCQDLGKINNKNAWKNLAFELELKILKDQVSDIGKIKNQEINEWEKLLKNLKDNNVLYITEKNLDKLYELVSRDAFNVEKKQLTELKKKIEISKNEINSFKKKIKKSANDEAELRKKKTEAYIEYYELYQQILKEEKEIEKIEKREREFDKTTDEIKKEVKARKNTLEKDKDDLEKKRKELEIVKGLNDGEKLEKEIKNQETRLEWKKNHLIGLERKLDELKSKKDNVIKNNFENLKKDREEMINEGKELLVDYQNNLEEEVKKIILTFNKSLKKKDDELDKNKKNTKLLVNNLEKEKRKIKELNTLLEREKHDSNKRVEELTNKKNEFDERLRELFSLIDPNVKKYNKIDFRNLYDNLKDVLETTKKALEEKEIYHQEEKTNKFTTEKEGLKKYTKLLSKIIYIAGQNGLGLKDGKIFTDFPEKLRALYSYNKTLNENLRKKQEETLRLEKQIKILKDTEDKRLKEEKEIAEKSLLVLKVVDELEEELKRLKLELQREKNNLKKSENEIEQLKKELLEKEQIIIDFREGYNKNLTKKKIETKELKETIEFLEKEIKILYTDLDQKQREKGNLKGRVENLQSNITIKETEINGYISEVGATIETVEKLKTNIKEKDKDIKILKDENVKLEELKEKAAEFLNKSEEKDDLIETIINELEILGNIDNVNKTKEKEAKLFKDQREIEKRFPELFDNLGNLDTDKLKNISDKVRHYELLLTDNPDLAENNKINQNKIDNFKNPLKNIDLIPFARAKNDLIQEQNDHNATRSKLAAANKAKDVVDITLQNWKKKFGTDDANQVDTKLKKAEEDRDQYQDDLAAEKASHANTRKDLDDVNDSIYTVLHYLNIGDLTIANLQPFKDAYLDLPSVRNKANRYENYLQNNLEITDLSNLPNTGKSLIQLINHAKKKCHVPVHADYDDRDDESNKYRRIFTKLGGKISDNDFDDLLNTPNQSQINDLQSKLNQEKQAHQQTQQKLDSKEKEIIQKINTELELGLTNKSTLEKTIIKIKKLLFHPDNSASLKKTQKRLSKAQKIIANLQEVKLKTIKRISVQRVGKLIPHESKKDFSEKLEGLNDYLEIKNLELELIDKHFVSKIDWQKKENKLISQQKSERVIFTSLLLVSLLTISRLLTKLKKLNVTRMIKIGSLMTK
ncbi:hypothetical protein [endosymbiont GvMRE of Glomus versiforme]|uniref:hypothetical protein n=1 Tax=endosymbiont GvMRE of Glomus versiforme TaxID=2039283 RepID=UPI000EE9F7E6|nr:hypothetical protein [endosymbiont GvMRE of Glomus versiforme]RHZ35670.1 hypothetical protein GvMRE_IIg305 [endosymbiont GvMRE of Glomus versiforme]